MKNLDKYLLRYEYTLVSDLDGMTTMEYLHGSKEIELIIGESLEMPWHEITKSKIVNIDVINNKICLKLIIPCRPLWESSSEIIYVTEDEISKLYYGRTTNIATTDYYFKFYIIPKEEIANQ